MTPRELVIAAIEHRDTPGIPYTLAIESPVDQELDTYYGSGDWRGRIVNHIARVCPFEVAGHEPVDEVRVRDMFGSVWRQDLRPTHHEEPGLKLPSFDGYRFPTLADHIDEAREAATRKALEATPDLFTAIGFGFGLYERTWTIRGFENSLMDCVAEEDFFDELVELIFQLHMGLIAECVKWPVDGVMFSDDWGDQRGVIIGPERWRRFIKPRLAVMYDAVHAAGKFTLSHCCGSVREIMPDLIEIGLDVIQSVQPEAVGMDPYGLKRDFGNDITFWGCLGSQSTIPFGTPDEIRAEVRRLRTEMSHGGGYILGPAKALQPGTPVENAAACVEAITEV